MIQDQLSAELQKVAVRYQRLWRWRTYAALLLVAAFVEFLAETRGHSLFRNSFVYGLALATGAVVAAICSTFLRRSVISDHHWIALKIEQQFPDLKSCLLA